MKRFLFVFGYESPQDALANEAGADAESSGAVWVDTQSEEEAIARGRSYAEDFVAAQFKKERSVHIPSWQAGNYAHWISRRPLEEFSGQALDLFDEI